MIDDRRPEPDALDALLEQAAASPADDARVEDALSAVAAHAGRPRRAPVVAIATVGAAAVLFSGGAVAATVYGPWLRVPDPVFSFERVWIAPDGAIEGTCRSQWMLAALPETTRVEAIAVLQQLDTDTVEPDPERLVALRERLAAGELDAWNWTDVNVRQRALELTISDLLVAELERQGPRSNSCPTSRSRPSAPWRRRHDAGRSGHDGHRGARSSAPRLLRAAGASDRGCGRPRR